MRQFLFFLSFLLISAYSIAQTGNYEQAKQYLDQRGEVYFQLQAEKSSLNKLSRIISIDKVEKNQVWAYANSSEFDKFLEFGLNYTVLTPPSLQEGKVVNMAVRMSQMSNWDRYPIYDLYVDMMNDFAADYPDLCRVEQIGTSVEGRKLLTLKITDNPDTEEDEPEFFYTGTMHGDETTGFVLLLRLADYLLSNYGTDPRVTNLVDNIEIYINPAANPDGTYAGGNYSVSGATRSNANSVDINRNFPDPVEGQYGNEQIEVTEMVNFAQEKSIVLSANFHGGTEVVNYPWDYKVERHPDDPWYIHLSRIYADSCHAYAPSNYMDGYNNGITNGYDWYSVNGGRQDHMNYFQNAREVTLEISDTKLLSSDLLPAHWTYNKAAMLSYMEECLYGIRGIVSDGQGNPLSATISVNGHDADNSEVVTDPDVGDYHRMIEEGTFDLTFTTADKQTKIISGVPVSYGQATRVDVFFTNSPQTINFAGSVVDDISDGAISSAAVEIESLSNSTNTNANGEFAFDNITENTYKMTVDATGFEPYVQFAAVASFNSPLQIRLTPELVISGVVKNAENHGTLEGATIEVLSSNISPAQTIADGTFRFGLGAGTYDIRVSKNGYETLEQNITVSESNHSFEFNLTPVAVGIKEFDNQITNLKIYPNPFASAFTLSFVLPESLSGKIQIFSLAGKQIDTVKEGYFAKGENRVVYQNTKLSQGVYILRFVSEKYSFEKKISVNR